MTAALALGMPPSVADAQAVSPVASQGAAPDLRASLTARVPTPRVANDALQARDVVLTRRLRAYAVGLPLSLLIGVVGAVVIMLSYGWRSHGDEGPLVIDSDYNVLGFAMVGLAGVGVIVTPFGMAMSGMRRDRVRRQLRTLTVAPLVSLSPQENVGGAQLRLTW